MAEQTENRQKENKLYKILKSTAITSAAVWAAGIAVYYIGEKNHNIPMEYAGYWTQLAAFAVGLTAGNAYCLRNLP